MCLYLTKRGATYYFRRSIPDELQPAFGGKTEFTFSLRTKDKEEAKRKRLLEALRTDKELEEAQARLGSEPRSAPASAPAALPLSEWEIAASEDDTRESLAQDERREELEEAISFLEQRLKGSTREMPPELRAFAYILRGREFDAELIRDQLTKTRAEKQELERRLGAGHQPPLPSANEATRGAIGPSAEARKAVMLDTAIVDLWAAERKPVKKGKDTHRQAAAWLYERIGPKSVDQLTRGDILAFKAKLVDDGQSAANIKMKLSRLRTLLQWAADNGYAESNPAQGVTIKDTDAAKNRRKPFDLPALRAIFASPVYCEGARPLSGKGEAAYWLPLLGLFTGARLEELGQLRPGDVVEEHYPDAEGREQHAWIIHIRADAEAGLSLKNAASERRVPVHAELERLGFIRFVQTAQKAGHERLFPLLKPNVYGRLTAKWGEWWSGYRRDVCGVTDRRMVFHSFRHTFKDYARHAGIPEGVQRQIMGHSAGDVADEYGSGYSLHQLVEGMRRYRVPGLSLSADAVSGCR